MGKDLLTPFTEQGFATLPFPNTLRLQLLSYIHEQIFALTSIKTEIIKDAALSIPDAIWSKKMTRACRIFPSSLASLIHEWADQDILPNISRLQSATNVVYPEEIQRNTKLTMNDKAIYWRCVRPGKPDAGNPHRDATFWELEFREGYDPKIPFQFDILKDCIKVWIPLAGCTPQTTLQIIPYSHKTEVPTIVIQTEYGRRPSICPQWLIGQEQKFISPKELSQGSAILFDLNLVHRGPQHTNETLRISAELNFIVKPLEGK